ncbi:hypothetical protein [Thiomonas intermedia]|uniref:hypothetical protein n=1 Tax=Thiomonas intermedia TaxID=926 RepID=UPI0012AB78F6|nr:hypothetical protein [Thiomonas intermedia]
MFFDPVAALLELLDQQGIAPADREDIAADGVLRRFRIEGDRRGTLNGWAVLHSDHGAAGSWKTGASCTWSSKATSRMTPGNVPPSGVSLWCGELRRA